MRTYVRARTGDQAGGNGADRGRRERLRDRPPPWCRPDDGARLAAADVCPEDAEQRGADVPEVLAALEAAHCNGRRLCRVARALPRRRTHHADGTDAAPPSLPRRELSDGRRRG